MGTIKMTHYKDPPKVLVKEKNYEPEKNSADNS